MLFEQGNDVHGFFEKVRVYGLSTNRSSRTTRKLAKLTFSCFLDCNFVYSKTEPRSYELLNLSQFVFHVQL